MADIPLEELEQMFAGVEANATWRATDELPWGYYFIDSKPRHLKRLAKRLGPLGYRVVAIRKVGPGTHVLHVERVEAHTPISLDQRNRELNALAAECGVRDYDGMDVGPPLDGD